MSSLSDTFFSEHLESVPIVLILRDMTPDKSREMARLAWDLGIRLVEVPVTSPESLHSLGSVLDESRHELEIVGAGSLRSAEQVKACFGLGIKFGVSPGTSIEVANAVSSVQLPWLPGVSTSSDIMLALSFGHNWLKAFPADTLGLPWMRAQAGPFPDVSFVATGGISTRNASEWLAHGAAALGIGGGAANPQALEEIVNATKRT
jgi:2-dehydro-3-deoxyphosphogluconate aldolase / (4S)-4-hydroxy-2-oxoglutarate aldolase